MIPWTEVLIRLGLAVVLGGVIGWQREHKERAAGLRTHMLVCVGSCLLMIVSVYAFIGPGLPKGTDAAKVAAGVITGMGFLGAGTIIKQGPVVKGLTTAASLWMTSGIGLALGMALYVPALLTTVLALVVLIAIKFLDPFISGGKGPKMLDIVLAGTDKQLAKLMEFLNKSRISVDSVNITASLEDESILKLALKLPQDLDEQRFLNDLKKEQGILHANWE